MRANLLGTRVGHFRYVDFIGKGGMGEVYVGYDEKLERKVALKTIRAEHRLDRESKARFLREARVLSQLHHPTICQIYEYIEGEDADVLVLELVKGRKLSQVDVPRFDFGKRLSLAIELSEAIVAAHGRGIVHRDLKPENIMLDAQGHVKVLDFGLSRSVADDETISLDLEGLIALDAASAAEITSEGISEESEAEFSRFQTQQGSILGTIGYMSPEQAHGKPATSASDIYSLGLVYQELFTGEKAFARSGGYPERLERAKSGSSLPVTGLDPDLAQLIERMKGLVPASRPTAVETLERLHWIEGKPARKRRRFLTAAALIILAALSIGAIIQAILLARERNRANQETDQARKALAFLTGTFEVANPRKGRGPSASAKEIIDGAVRKLDETKGQPLLQASLLMTLSDIYDEMGLYDAAEPLAKRALKIREETPGSDRMDAAASLNNLATIWRKQGRLAEAETLAMRGLDLREKALGQSHPDVASSLNALAIIRWRRGNLTEAEELLKRSLLIREKALGPDHPDVATSLNNMATLYADQGRLAAAETLYRRSLETWEKALGPDHPDVATSLNNLASIYLDQGKLAEAEPLLKRSLVIRERTLGPSHPDVAMTLNNIADLYRDRGKFSEAEPLLQRSLEIKERTLGPDHPDAALALYNLGVLELKQGNRAKALAYMRRAIPHFLGTSYWQTLVEKDADIAPLRSDPEFKKIVTSVKKYAAAKDGVESP